jgi:hypothetical protein
MPCFLVRKDTRIGDDIATVWLCATSPVPRWGERPMAYRFHSRSDASLALSAVKRSEGEAVLSVEAEA